MGGIRYVSVLILTALLVFGCLGAPQEAPPAGGDTTPPSGDTDNVSGETPEAPTEPSEPTAPSEPSTDNLEGLGYEALLALGQSVECTITTSDYGGQVMTMKIYMKGEDRIRSEFTGTTQTTCPKYISINKDGVAYLGCEGGDFFEGIACDWLMSEPDPSEPSGAAPSMGFEQPMLEEVPPANIQCKIWIYDESKFDTPGIVCTPEELMAAMYDIPPN